MRAVKAFGQSQLLSSEVLDADGGICQEYSAQFIVAEALVRTPAIGTAVAMSLGGRR